MIPGAQEEANTLPQPVVAAWPLRGGCGPVTRSSLPCFESPCLGLWPRSSRRSGCCPVLRPYLTSCVAPAPPWARQPFFLTVQVRLPSPQPQPSDCRPESYFSFSPGAQATPAPLSYQSQETPQLTQQPRHPHSTLAPLGTAASKANKSHSVPFPGLSPSRFTFSVIVVGQVTSPLHVFVHLKTSLCGHSHFKDRVS